MDDSWNEILLYYRIYLNQLTPIVVGLVLAIVQSYSKDMRPVQIL